MQVMRTGRWVYAHLRVFLVCLGVMVLGMSYQPLLYAAGCPLVSSGAEKVCPDSAFSVNDQFLLAVAKGNLARAKQLVAHGARLDYRSSTPYVVEKTRVRADITSPFLAGNKRYQFASGTAYDIALSRYDTDMVQWLLNKGANPAAGYFANRVNQARFVGVYPNRYLRLPFSQRAKIISVGYVMELAVQQNDLSAVRHLLKIEPRSIHYRGNVILLNALQTGKYKIANLLLDQGRDVSQLTNFERLFDSVMQSEPTQYALLKKLLHLAQKRKGFTYTQLLAQAIDKQDDQALQLLVKAGADLNPKRGLSPLYSLLDKEDLRTTRTLLALGADPNRSNGSESLLQRAIRYEKPEFVKLYLQHGASPKAAKKSYVNNLQLAMSKDDLQYTKMLIAAGADVNQVATNSLNTPLMTAVQQVRPKLVDLLIRAGADVNAVNNAQETALHIATRKADKGLMTRLLDARANPNLVNRQHETPLLIAVDLKNESLVDLLMRYKAKINLADSSGRTALHRAVDNQNLPIVRKLLAAGAVPNTTSSYTGSTPLIDALNNRRAQIALLLINSGANLNVVSNARETPLDIARKRGLRQVAQVIRKKGGKTASEIGANPEDIRVRTIYE